MVDTFSKHVAPVATNIGKLAITLISHDNGTGDEIYYNIVLKDENGIEIKFRKEAGNLRPFLTEGQITTIETFLSDMRAKAAEMLT